MGLLKKLWKYVSKHEEWEPSICCMCDVKLEHRQLYRTT